MEKSVQDLRIDALERRVEKLETKSEANSISITRLMIYGAIGAFILTVAGGVVISSMANKLVSLPTVQTK